MDHSRLNRAWDLEQLLHACDSDFRGLDARRMQVYKDSSAKYQSYVYSLNCLVSTNSLI